MDLKDVKLNLFEEFMVILRTCNKVTPWKLVFTIIASDIVFKLLGFPLLFCASVGTGVGVSIFGVCRFLTQCVLPDIEDYLVPIYEDYREKAKKESLEKVDDRLLR